MAGIFDNVFSSFISVSARVNDKKNFLQVESERFLKFKQDYNELGMFLYGTGKK